MIILNKPINTLGFDDISEFCKQGHIEGIQLDYKRELPSKGLAKHFASFSNTRGGVIIVGVEEDKKTGIPIAWEGIKNEGKLIDRVHQYAANVEPIPSYEVCVTEENNGNVFLLIHIFEGDRTPYYVQNDSNLWTRTGNISNPIDIASPDYAETLFGKKDKAEIARSNYIKRTNQIYEAALLRAEKERHKLIVKEKKEIDYENQKAIIETGKSTNWKSQYVQGKLGTNVAMLTMLAQPFYPRKALITPLDLIKSLNKIQITAPWLGEFPSSNMEPIQDGLLKFYWNHSDGEIRCEQIYSNGLVFHAADVLKPHNSEQHVNLNHIAALLIVFLKALGNIFRYTSYQGGIVGYVMLEDIENIWINQIESHKYFPDENHKSLLGSYKWDLELDTSILNDNLLMQEYFIEKIKEFYWSIGYMPANEELYKDFLRGLGWLVENETS